MKINLTITWNGKKHSVVYEKQGESFLIEALGDELKKLIPIGFKFWLKNGKAFFLITDPKIREFADIIVPQIMDDYQRLYQ